MKRSKRYRAAVGCVDRSSRYSVADAVALLKGMDGVRDWETVEISLLLGIDPKQGAQIVRGSVSLPNGVGATKRVFVFAEGGQGTAGLGGGARYGRAQHLGGSVMGHRWRCSVDNAAWYTRLQERSSGGTG